MTSLELLFALEARDENGDQDIPRVWAAMEALRAAREADRVNQRDEMNQLAQDEPMLGGTATPWAKRRANGPNS